MSDTGAPSAAAAAVKPGPAPGAPAHPRAATVTGSSLSLSFKFDRGVANEATAICHDPDCTLAKDVDQMPDAGGFHRTSASAYTVRIAGS